MSAFGLGMIVGASITILVIAVASAIVSDDPDDPFDDDDDFDGECRCGSERDIHPLHRPDLGESGA